jgi:hypothetical protein
MRRDQNPILLSPYEIQVLAERFAGIDAPRRLTLVPETARTICHALRTYADLLTVPKDDTGFTIDLWAVDGGLMENMARSSNGSVARAAFERACSERPGFKITLRQGIRLINVREAPARAGQSE